MRLSTDHECAAPGCITMIAGEMLMCRHHWRRVPKELQTLIYETLSDRNRKGAGMGERRAYLDAVRLAKQSLSL